MTHRVHDTSGRTSWPNTAARLAHYRKQASDHAAEPCYRCKRAPVHDCRDCAARKTDRFAGWRYYRRQRFGRLQDRSADGMTLWTDRVADLNTWGGFMGYADEIAPRAVENQGWFCRCDDYDGVYRGLVVRMRSPRGAIYLPGYEDTEAGSVRLSLADAIYTRKGATEDEHDDAKRDAALSADGNAKHDAEKALAYDTAWQAGNRHADNETEMQGIRDRVREVIREYKSLTGALPDGICSTVRAAVQNMLADLQELRDINAALRDGEGAPGLSFWSGDRELRAAFNDGAGRAVLK